MKHLIKKGLLIAGRYVLNEALREFEVIPTLKETLKSKLVYSLTINHYGSYEMHRELTKFLVKNYRHKLRDLDTSFERKPTLKHEQDEYDFEYGLSNGRFFIKENGCRILVIKKRDRKEDSYASDISDYYKLYTRRQDKDKLDNFLKKLMENAHKNRKKSEDIITYIFGDKGWEAFREYTPIHIDNVITPKEIKDRLINDIEKFLSRKDWYLRKNLTFKRGYLLYGKPRNGKSSLIEAIARKYRRDIYFLNLNSIPSEKALLHAFRDMRPDSILIVEDIDTVWNKRETALADCKITFSTFINCMSGVLERGDIITFFTTNFYEQLDEALIGSKRIDLQIEIPQPKKAEAEAYLSNLYEEEVKLDRYVEGRSMGSLLNLFEENMDDKQKLIDFLNNEDENTSFDDEPIPEKFRSIITKHSQINEDGLESSCIPSFNVSQTNTCTLCAEEGECTGECEIFMQNPNY
jgi:hypothetical protein